MLHIQKNYRNYINYLVINIALLGIAPNCLSYTLTQHQLGAMEMADHILLLQHTNGAISDYLDDNSTPAEQVNDGSNMDYAMMGLIAAFDIASHMNPPDPRSVDYRTAVENGMMFLAACQTMDSSLFHGTWYDSFLPVGTPLNDQVRAVDTTTVLFVYVLYLMETYYNTTYPSLYDNAQAALDFLLTHSVDEDMYNNKFTFSHYKWDSVNEEWKTHNIQYAADNVEVYMGMKAGVALFTDECNSLPNYYASYNSVVERTNYYEEHFCTETGYGTINGNYTYYNDDAGFFSTPGDDCTYDLPYSFMNCFLTNKNRLNEYEIDFNVDFNVGGVSGGNWYCDSTPIQVMAQAPWAFGSDYPVCLESFQFLTGNSSWQATWTTPVNYTATFDFFNQITGELNFSPFAVWIERDELDGQTGNPPNLPQNVQDKGYTRHHTQYYMAATALGQSQPLQCLDWVVDNTYDRPSENAFGLPAGPLGLGGIYGNHFNYENNQSPSTQTNSKICWYNIAVSELPCFSGFLDGTVSLNGGSGNVENVEIEFDGINNDFTVYPDGNGTYSSHFFPIEYDTYTITYSLDGYDTEIRNMNIDNLTTTLPSVILSISSIELSGQVSINGGTGYVQDVDILMQKQGSSTTFNPEPNNQGNYSQVFTYDDFGEYEIQYSLQYYDTIIISEYQINEGTNSLPDVCMEPSDIEISGIVELNGGSGNLADVDILFYKQDGTNSIMINPDESGAYSQVFSFAVFGLYNVTFSMDYAFGDYYPVTIEVDVGYETGSLETTLYSIISYDLVIVSINPENPGFRNIQAGLDYLMAKQANGKVNILAGLYTGEGNENLTWDPSISHIIVKGINPETCIIETNSIAFNLNHTQAESTLTDAIENLTIRNAGYGIHNNMGVRIIRNNIFSDCLIAIKSESHVDIINNLFENTFVCALELPIQEPLFGRIYCSIENNEFKQNNSMMPLLILDGTRFKIINNFFHDNTLDYQQQDTMAQLSRSIRLRMKTLLF